MASGDVLGRKLRAWSIAALASGMVILCLLALFFPALRDMVPPPQPTPVLTPAPSTPPVTPSMSATLAPSPSASARPVGQRPLDWPGPASGVDPNPPPAPGDKR